MCISHFWWETDILASGRKHYFQTSGISGGKIHSTLYSNNQLKPVAEWIICNYISSILYVVIPLPSHLALSLISIWYLTSPNQVATFPVICSVRHWLWCLYCWGQSSFYEVHLQNGKVMITRVPQLLHRYFQKAELILQASVTLV